MKIYRYVLICMMQLFVHQSFAQNTDQQKLVNSTRKESLNIIYKEKDPVKKEKLYLDWLENFPVQQCDSAEKVKYDYASYSVASAYAGVNNVAKAMNYSNLFKTTAWKAQGWSSLASTLEKNGHLNEAVELYKRALTHSYNCVISNNYDVAVQIAATGYPLHAKSLSKLYVKQKNYQAALLVLKQLYERPEYADAEAYEAYASLLMQSGKYRESFAVLDNAAKSGLANEPMKNNLKILFGKVNGKGASYDDYLASVNKAMIEKVRENAAKTMVNLPAINFSLTDVDGKNVSLSELKGKTVILDFWATWCGPCKSSFPIMKAAMERFKDDPDVVFLFIHTFERDENAPILAKTYMSENHYPFRVLMDLKNTEGINPVAASYKLGGIPAKIVIDKNGNIRFSVIGFSGEKDVAVEELAAMIKLAQKS